MMSRHEGDPSNSAGLAVQDVASVVFVSTEAHVASPGEARLAFHSILT